VSAVVIGNLLRWVMLITGGGVIAMCAMTALRFARAWVHYRRWPGDNPQWRYTLPVVLLTPSVAITTYLLLRQIVIATIDRPANQVTWLAAAAFLSAFGALLAVNVNQNRRIQTLARQAPQRHRHLTSPRR
jgi:hypothetical protein